MRSVILSIRSAFIVIIMLLMAACTIGSPTGEVVEKEVEGFFKARQQQSTDLALGFYSNKRSAEEWRSHYEHVESNLGHVESFRKIRMEVNTVLSGRFYIFDYQVKYKSGAEAKETLTFLDTVEEDDKFGIVAHVITADGYRQLF